jgi:hypothetical protein
MTRSRGTPASQGKHGHGKKAEEISGLLNGYVELKNTLFSSFPDSMQFIAVRKTLEANMHMTDLFPPGRVLWALRDSDLHPSHRLSTSKKHEKKDPKSSGDAKEIGGQDKLRLFEVMDVEKVFSQIVFAKDMLRYGNRSLFQKAQLLKYSFAAHICRINTIEYYMTFCNSQVNIHFVVIALRIE